jgi:hypothetical protein
MVQLGRMDDMLISDGPPYFVHSSLHNILFSFKSTPDESQNMNSDPLSVVYFSGSVECNVR